MRKSLLIALVALSAGMALPQSALANELPNREAERYEQNAQADIKSAEATLRKATDLAQRLSQMLDEARKEKRIMDADFLNRRLTQTNALVRELGSRVKAISNAYGGGDRDRARHERTVINEIVSRLEQIEDEVALYFDPNYKRAKQTTSDEEKTELKLPSPLLLPGSPGGGGPVGPSLN